MRDMRNTPSGNPTVTENYNDTNETITRYSTTWTSKKTLRIWDTHQEKVIWDAEVTDTSRSLIEAFGIKIPDSPYDLPKTKTTIDVWVVATPTDEYHSEEVGLFWQYKDAKAYAELNPGWYGAASTVHQKTIRIYGKR